MMWVIAVVALLVMLIPLVSIVLDSDVGRALARRLEPQGPADGTVERRLESIEEELEYLSEAVRSLQARVRESGPTSD
jgi:hypothetical protein